MKAVEALGEIGDVKAVNYLENVVENVGRWENDSKIETAAKQALEKIKQKR